MIRHEKQLRDPLALRPDQFVDEKPHQAGADFRLPMVELARRQELEEIVRQPFAELPLHELERARVILRPAGARPELRLEFPDPDRPRDGALLAQAQESAPLDLEIPADPFVIEAARQQLPAELLIADYAAMRLVALHAEAALLADDRLANRVRPLDGKEPAPHRRPLEPHELLGRYAISLLPFLSSENLHQKIRDSQYEFPFAHNRKASDGRISLASRALAFIPLFPI